MYNAKLAPLLAQFDMAEASLNSESWEAGNEPKVRASIVYFYFIVFFAFVNLFALYIDRLSFSVCLLDVY